MVNITYKSPTSVGQSTYGSYPTGYNKDNCTIIASMSNHNGNWNDEFGNYFAFGLESGGIRCYAVQSGRLGDNVRVTLTKV